MSLLAFVIESMLNYLEMVVNSLVSLIIQGDSENKNRLALGKGFKIIESEARIIHDTNGNLDLELIKSKI